MMMLDRERGAFSPSPDDLECKICYCAYSLRGHRPKVLSCSHRLCSSCLSSILELGESPPGALVCPFCRQVTALRAERTSGGNLVCVLPDDCGVLGMLALCGGSPGDFSRSDSPAELLLSPGGLGSVIAANPPLLSTSYSTIRSSPNFLVITIMEPPPRAPESGPDPSARWALCRSSLRALVWVLGLLYFGSLPVGVYLLILQRSTAGLLLVSLVPASLASLMLYGCCRCVCRELWDCVPGGCRRVCAQNFRW